MEVTQLTAVSWTLNMCFMLEEDDVLVLHGMKRKRRYWMAPYLKNRTNPYQKNTLAKLERDFLRLGTVDEFIATLRMPLDVYHELLTLVTPLILRHDTNYRKAITPGERLSLTMRYLALGDSMRTLHQAYLVGHSTVPKIIRDTCQAIYDVLHEDYLKTPTTLQEWQDIATGFHDRWNFPNVIGAIDGKHVRIRCPKNSGSLYYNYKGYFSMVLMAVVSHDYKFLFVDAGAEGRASDSRVLKQSEFFQDLTAEDNPLQIPAACHVPGFQGDLPYYFVADEAFALGEHLMKPYPSAKLSLEQRVYNYRLSRCRRIVENAFGILSSRFRIFQREMDMAPEGNKKVIMACVALHNFLRVKAGKAYIPKGSTDWEDKDYQVHKGQWRREELLDPIRVNQHDRNHSRYIKSIRNRLANWCLTKEGKVRWQYDIMRMDIDNDK